MTIIQWQLVKGQVAKPLTAGYTSVVQLTQGSKREAITDAVWTRSPHNLPHLTSYPIHTK